MDARKLWLPFSAVLALLGTIFGLGVAWASNSNKVDSLAERTTKLEIAVQNISNTMDSLRESNITLKVSMQNLAEKVGEVGKDVKDIRTLVK